MCVRVQRAAPAKQTVAHAATRERACCRAAARVEVFAMVCSQDTASLSRSSGLSSEEVTKASLGEIFADA